jgi:L-aminopeptidase/D-esterase-like protein
MHTAILQLLATILVALVFSTTLLGQGPITPEPKVNQGERVLKFDFPEMLVGTAEYDEGPTGTTVFYFPDSVKAAVDVLGGSPGTVNAAALMNSREAKMMEAVVLSGGSWYGLSAATGVANGIKELKAAENKPNFIAGVVGAIIYDVGGRRMTRITPDDRLGRAAVKAAKPGWFPLGATGGGRFAMQGFYFQRPFDVARAALWSHSGQGGSFKQIGPSKIGVFTVVNSLGTIVDRNGRVVRCSRNDPAKKCPLISNLLIKATDAIGKEAEKEPRPGPTNNTTITLVVTNQKMQFADLQRLARQVHSSMSRAIQPFATEQDGDVLYAVTTDEVENPGLSSLDLAVIASEVAWDAILSSVPQLPPVPRRAKTAPTMEELEKYVGDYEFNEFSRITIRIESGSLVAKYGGIGQIYFWLPKHKLVPAENGRFIVDLPAKDVIGFDVSDGEVIGLTLNPGHWALKAHKVDKD